MILSCLINLPANVWYSTYKIFCLYGHLIYDTIWALTFVKLFKWPSFLIFETPCNLATFWRISLILSQGSAKENTLLELTVEKKNLNMHSTCNFRNRTGTLPVLIKDADHFCLRKHQFDLNLEPKAGIPEFSRTDANAYGGDTYFKADFNHPLIFTIDKEIHLVSEIPILKSHNSFIFNPLVM